MALMTPFIPGCGMNGEITYSTLVKQARGIRMVPTNPATYRQGLLDEEKDAPLMGEFYD